MTSCCAQSGHRYTNVIMIAAVAVQYDCWPHCCCCCWYRLTPSVTTFRRANRTQSRRRTRSVVQSNSLADLCCSIHCTALTTRPPSTLQQCLQHASESHITCRPRLFVFLVKFYHKFHDSTALLRSILQVHATVAFLFVRVCLSLRAPSKYLDYVIK